MRYLNTVLGDINNAGKGLNAEHVYKLNEAVFNLPEEDTVDSRLASKLFTAVGKIRTAYNTGKMDDRDSNFFYDYVALLGTMQNQHFFSPKQTDSMIEWITEVSGSSEPA